jgi:multiple sugar transport system substrate-binding protein
MNYSTISEWARRDVLLPLDSYVGNGLDLSDFDTSQIAAGTVDDTLYGVSLGYSAFGLMLNKTVWEQAGVDLPSMATDWEEFGRMGAEVTKAAGRPNFYGLQDGSGVVAAFQNWLRQRGKELYDQEGRLGYNEEDATDWFALWAALRDTKACTPPELTALDQLTVETAMITLGYAATSYGYSNQLVGYRAVNKNEIVLVPTPMLNDDASHGLFMQSAQSFSVTKASETPDAAVAFIDFFVHDPEAAKVLGVERGMPASSKIRAILAPQLDEAGQDSAAYLELVGPTGGALPPPPPTGATEMNAVLKRTSEEVSFDTKTPQEGAKTLIDEAARVLKAA